MSASSALHRLHWPTPAEEPEIAATPRSAGNSVSVAFARYVRYRRTHWREAAAGLVLAAATLVSWVVVIEKLL